MIRQFTSLSIAAVCAAVLFSAFGAAVVADEPSEAEVAAREKAFAEQLGNVTLTGVYTVDGKTDALPKPESYVIESVNKAVGNLWTFNVRIKYGKTDARLPVTVPIVWAGNTPMVSLENATIPGLGTEFSAKVIFDGNRYAGTWAHGKVGGHMYGTIKKNQDEKKQEAAAATK